MYYQRIDSSQADQITHRTEGCGYTLRWRTQWVQQQQSLTATSSPPPAVEKERATASGAAVFSMGSGVRR